MKRIAQIARRFGLKVTSGPNVPLSCHCQSEHTRRYGAPHAPTCPRYRAPRR